jgi:hypothetical protein
MRRIVTEGGGDRVLRRSRRRGQSSVSMMWQLRGVRPRLGLDLLCVADMAQIGLIVDEFRLRRAGELRGEAEPVGERVRLGVEIVDLLACCLQRFPYAFQSAVLGVGVFSEWGSVP